MESEKPRQARASCSVMMELPRNPTPAPPYCSSIQQPIRPFSPAFFRTSGMYTSS